MPICPGCERTVPYDRLPTHEQYCTELDTDRNRQLERLERRIEETERRMYRRLRALEAELEVGRSRSDENGAGDGRSRTSR